MLMMHFSVDSIQEVFFFFKFLEKITLGKKIT